MAANLFQLSLNFVEKHGYFLIFLAMVAEGPFVTMAAAFAASLGLFNIYLIYVISVLGDLVADVLLYGVGRITRKGVVERYNMYFGFKRKTVEKLERGLKNHLGKSLTLIKWTPWFSTPALILTGTLKVDFKKFFFFSLIITLIRSLIFTLLGYYAGILVNNSVKYFDFGQYFIPLVILAIVLLYYFISKFIGFFVKRKVGLLKK